MQPVTSNFKTQIEASRQKPISRIKIFDTAKSISSKGFNCSFYTLDNNDAMINGNWMGTSPNWTPASGITRVYPTDKDDLDYIIEPSTILAKDFGVAGSPHPIGETDLWAARWYGHFFARYSGVYRFHLDCSKHSRLRIKFNGSYLTLKDPDDDSTVDIWTDTTPNAGVKKELYADTTSLTSGNWYSLQVELWQPQMKIPPRDPTYMCVKYREPNTTTAFDEFGNTSENVVSDYQSDYPEKKVLSAGVVNTTNSFLSGTELTQVINIRGNKDINQASEYEFELPIPNATRLAADVTAGDASITVKSTDGFPSFGFGAIGSDEFTYTGKTSTTFTGIPSGAVDGWFHLSGGTMYIVQNNVATTGGSGTGCKVNILAVTDGVITNIEISNPGSGYSLGNFLIIVGENNDATFRVTSFSDKALGTHSTGEVVHLKSAGDYPYNPSDKSYGEIRAFKLCTIELGYEDFEGSPNSYYQYRIWGHIFPNPIVTRNEDGTDVLRVRIQDFKSMLLREYNRNYPDFASYSGAGYYDEHLLSEPDGIDRPTAYDRWNLDKAVRDILMKSNVDPVLLYGRQRKNVSGTPLYETDYGEYLLRGNTQLDSKKKYGRPSATGQSGNEDEEYNWVAGYGNKQIELLVEFARNFGYQFGFDSNGFVFFRPVNLPSTIYDDRDLTWSGDSSDQTETNLNCYKATYTKVTLVTVAYVEKTGIVCEDLKIIFRPYNGTTKIKIAIKPDGGTYSYLDKILWNGSVITASSDVFSLAYTETWNYYDGVASDTGENPSVIELNSLDDLVNGYGKYDLKIEMAGLVDSTFELDSIFIYKNAVRKTARDIDTTLTFGDLTVEQDVEDIRNDVVVVGSQTGLFQNSDEQVINPNNPIYVHTYARAVDLDSMYDSSDNNYIGLRIPFEIYNTTILDKPRADHIAISALKKYRKPESLGLFEFSGDPRIEPFDCLGFQEKKLNLLPSGDKIWTESLSEEFSQTGNGVKYTIQIGSASPREPLSSYQSKPEPDISEFNDKAIINIELRSQSKRIAGGDGTGSTNLLTIGTDPLWIDDMWIGYYLYDNDGTEFKITDNDTNTLTVDGTPTTGNWSISFDPFDADQKGAPLEIHYDQIINGKLTVLILNENYKEIKNINKDTENEIKSWGGDRVVYWDGVVETNLTNVKYSGYYVSPKTTKNYQTLTIYFKLTDENGVVYLYNSLIEESSRIYPKILTAPPMIQPKLVENQNFGDVQFGGRITDHNVVSGKSRFTFGEVSNFSIDQWNDYKLVICMQAWYILAYPQNVAYKITDTIAPNIIEIDDDVTQTGYGFIQRIAQDGDFNFYAEVRGTTDTSDRLKDLIHHHFKPTDNNDAGVKLTLEAVNISSNWNEGTVTKDGTTYNLGDPLQCIGIWSPANNDQSDWDKFDRVDVGIEQLYYWIDQSQYHNKKLETQIYGYSKGNTSHKVYRSYPERGIYLLKAKIRWDQEVLADVLPEYDNCQTLINGDIAGSVKLTIYNIYYKTGATEMVKFGPTEIKTISQFMPISDFVLHYNIANAELDTNEENVKYTPTFEEYDNEPLETYFIDNADFKTIGWYLVFDLFLVDRAGRPLSNFICYDENKILDAPLRIVIGWMPIDTNFKSKRDDGYMKLGWLIDPYSESMLEVWYD